MFGLTRELAIWLWGIPALFCLLLPNLYFWNEKSYSEEELTKISPKFYKINRKNMSWSFFWLCFSMLLLLIYRQSESLDYPFFVIAISGLAITHATFALNYDAYPEPKVLSYHYVDSVLNHRIAKLQIFFALTLSTASLVLYYV